MQILRIQSQRLRNPHTAVKPNGFILVLVYNREQNVGVYLQWIDKDERKCSFSHYYYKTPQLGSFSLIRPG